MRCHESLTVVAGSPHRSRPRIYVEAMLRQQLVAAIGKEVTVADFAAYMRSLAIGTGGGHSWCFMVQGIVESYQVIMGIGASL